MWFRLFSVVSLMSIFVLSSSFAHAGKPSLKRAIRDAGFRNVIKCKFKSGGKITTKGIHVYYTRQMECVMKGGVKGHPKIKKVHDGYVEYLKSGSRYTYKSWFPWSTWYLGLKPPKAALVLKLVKANKLNFLGRRYHHGYIVGDLENLKMADKPMWTWTSPTALRVNVVGEYHWKKGGWEVEHVRHLKWVYLKRDTIDSPWKYEQTSKTRNSADRKVLTVKKYSEDEYNKLKTIKELAESSQANAHMASLPKVKVPIFKSEDELVNYTWNMLRTANAKELESYLRQVYSKFHFIKGSKVIMTNRSEKEMHAAIKLAVGGKSKFKDQYCKTPLKKERGVFYNKIKSTWTRIRAIPGEGKWVEGKKVPGTYKLNTLQVSIVKGDALARMKSMSKDMCPRELTAAEKALSIPRADGKGVWKIGDKVMSKYKGRNRWYAGKVAGIKDGKVFIKYNDGDKEWTTPNMLAPPR